MARVIPSGLHELFSVSAAVAGALIGGPSIGLGRELGAIVRARVARHAGGGPTQVGGEGQHSG